MTPSSAFSRSAPRALLAASLLAVTPVAPVAHAQTRGGFLASGVTYQAPLNTPTLGGHTLFGAAFGHPISRRLALAVNAAMGTGLVRPQPYWGPDGFVASPSSVRRTHLDLGGELRSRLRGGRDLDQSEFYLVAGGSVLRTHLADEDVTLQPQAHAGFAVTLPFAQSVGLEARAAYVAARLTPHLIGYASDTTSWVTTVGGSGTDISNQKAKWYGAVRAGLSFYLRPVARPRRIPPQYVPDATSRVEPSASFEGTLLDRAEAALAQKEAGDDKLGADPSAGAGGTIRGDYLVKIPTTLAEATAKGKGKRMPKDSLLVLATPLPEPVAAPIVPTAAPAAAPAAAVAQAGTARPVTPLVAAPAAVPVQAPVVAARAIEDSVVSESDATTDYLVIRPVLVGGHIRPASADRLVALAGRYLASGRILDYAIVLESASADQASADLLLEDAYALRARLIDAGVVPTRIIVREVATDRGTSAIRVLLRSPKASTAPRGR